MFTIRRIHDDFLPANQAAIAQAAEILRAQFGGLPEEEIEAFERRMSAPIHPELRPMLYVAERRRQVHGFASIHVDTKIAFAYLEFIASDAQTSGRGFGAALYQRVREDMKATGMKGLFFECLPDDPKEIDDPAILKQNKSRLRFYEHFGARPVDRTEYQAPLRPGQRGLPYLVYDGLGGGPPSRAYVREVVRAILERKYSKICTPEYVKMVVDSIRDDPVRIRPPRYATKAAAADVQRRAVQVARAPHIMVVNDRHEIHHVRERGYVESPVRIHHIVKELASTGLFESVPAKTHGMAPILAVHDQDFVEYLRRACQSVKDKSVYPYVFPIRNATRPPKELSVRAGYYCIDTFTPLNSNAYAAAVRAVDCTLTAAAFVLDGERLAYALVRPPGHHAERRSFGGFCYFNNNAIAANVLSRQGKVAILDIDYHHGNGQQDIFFDRSDVLTVSIHGHPNIAYPFFTGFEDEVGAGPGEGFNLNLPLAEVIDGARYQKALTKALDRIARFNPAFLVVALGLDTAKGDPTGTWSLHAADFRANGRRIGELGRPTLVVQEGGYRTRTLGANARAFFEGLSEAQRVV